MTDQRGSLSAFIVCVAAGCLALTAFVHDSGRAMSHYVGLADAAQNAARVGAQAVRDIRSGDPRLDEAGAVRRAHDHLAGLGLTGEVESDGLQVTVTIVDSMDAQMLTMFGVGPKKITVRRSAIVRGG